MSAILALLRCLQPWITATTARQLSHITRSMLAMTGRVTLVGIARWTGAGGRYRTLQRCCATALPGAQLVWCVFRQHLVQTDDGDLLAGDEVGVTKAGKHTHGLGRFCSSIDQRAVPGLAFFSLALVSTKARRAFPLRREQGVHPEGDQAVATPTVVAKANDSTPKRKPGRPQGSKNKSKADSPRSPELQRIQRLVQALGHLIAGLFPLTSRLLDGHFGTSAALQMTPQCGVHLISNLRSDAALYEPSAGPDQGRGPRRNYGANLTSAAPPAKYRQQTTVAGATETRIYHANLRHKDFPQPLNVVIIAKLNRPSQKQAHVIWFSSDLTLTWDKLIDYDGLRFQLEFTFRAAKQDWGLEECRTVTPTGVTNAANLSLCMVNLRAVLLTQFREQDPQWSMLDLKAFYRGSKYVTELIKLLPEPPDDDLMAQLFHQMAQLGRIHPPQPQPRAA